MNKKKPHLPQSFPSKCPTVYPVTPKFHSLTQLFLPLRNAYHSTCLETPLLYPQNVELLVSSLGLCLGHWSVSSSLL